MDNLQLKKPKIQKFLASVGLQAFRLSNLAVNFPVSVSTGVLMNVIAAGLGLYILPPLVYSVIGTFTGLIALESYRGYRNKDMSYPFAKSASPQDLYFHNLHKLLTQFKKEYPAISEENKALYILQKKAQLFILTKDFVWKNNERESFADNNRGLIKFWEKEVVGKYPVVRPGPEQPSDFEGISKYAENAMTYFRAETYNFLQNPEFAPALAQEMKNQQLGLVELSFELSETHALHTKINKTNNRHSHTQQPTRGTVHLFAMTRIALQTGETLDTEQTKELLKWISKIQTPKVMSEYLSLIVNNIQSSKQIDLVVLKDFLIAQGSLNLRADMLEVFEKIDKFIASDSGHEYVLTTDFLNHKNSSSNIFEALKPERKEQIENQLQLFKPAVLKDIAPQALLYNLEQTHLSAEQKGELQTVFLTIKNQLDSLEKKKSLLTDQQSMELRVLVNNNLPSLVFHVEKLSIISQDDQTEHFKNLLETAQLMSRNIGVFQNNISHSLTQDLAVLKTHMQNKMEGHKELSETPPSSATSHTINQAPTTQLQSRDTEGQEAPAKTLKAKR